MDEFGGFDPELIYDTANETFVLCMTGYDLPNYTFILQDNQWQPAGAANEPPGGVDIGFVYDEARQVGVWYDGNETWTWDGSDWTKQDVTNGPVFYYGQFVMTYDTVRDVTLLYGNAQTWTWDGQTWTQLSPAHSPDAPADTPERGFFALGFDQSRGVAVLYGGEPANSMGETLFDDVWEWNGADWSVYTPGSPVFDWSIY